MSGFQPINGERLSELMRLSWILAVALNGDRIDVVTDGEWPVKIVLTPAIGDYGTWGCRLDIDYKGKLGGRGLSSHSGTVDSALVAVRESLREMFGGGYL